MIRQFVFTSILCFLFLSMFLSCKKEKIDAETQKNNLVFNPNLKYGTLKDIDGNIYKTIQIGSQVWMAENLKTTKYSDGTSIAIIPGNATKLDEPGRCYYNNDKLYNDDYGVLYNGYALNSKTNGNRSVCPVGWHIPSTNEWLTLIKYLCDVELNMYNDHITGGKLKEVGITHWEIPSIYSTNSSGFTAVPAGIRNAGFSPLYEGIGTQSFYWCSDVVATNASSSFSIFDIHTSAHNYMAFDYRLSNQFFFSVRCLKD